MYVPVEQPVPLRGIRNRAATLHQIARHEGQRIPSAKNTVVIEAEPGANQVEQVVNVLDRCLQAALECGTLHPVQGAEHRLPGQRRGHATQQQFKPKVVPGARPTSQFPVEPLPSLRPLSAHLCQRKVSLRQLRAAAVHTIEDVNDHIDRLVFSGHFLDVEIRLLDAVDPVQPMEEVADPMRVRRVGDESLDDNASALLQQFGYVDP